jgi:Pyridoxamine 5'-phosphate oxidase
VPVGWGEEEDAILGGDLAAVLAYCTPAGGSVPAAVAPLGLRDRERGEVTFTTSLGLGRKLERIRANPRVALAYHAREHGFATGSRYVLVQGTASFDSSPDQSLLNNVVRPASTRFLGPPKTGFFWDRYLREYYADRVLVTVAVERVAGWPNLRCEGEPEVAGAPLPREPPPPQGPPMKGSGPRIDVSRAAKRLRSLPHVLLAFPGADGFPLVYPVEVGEANERGIALRAAAGLLPPGGRRAGLLGHRFNAKLIGLESRQHTGWLEVNGESAIYAPHTEAGFRAPANKTLLLLGNGLMAKRGLKKARAAAASGG